MSTELRPGLRSRLADQGRRRPGRDVDPTPRWGDDEGEALRVQVDPTGWVSDVRVERMTDELRDPAGLRSALRSAIDRATWAHRVAWAETEAANASPRDLERGRHLVESRASVRAPTVRLPPRTSADELREQARRRGLVHATHDALAERRATGSSDRGELTVTMGWRDGFRSLDVDEPWLSTVDASMLRFALREAFTAAANRGDEQS